MRIVECVPNFSEGRNKEIIDRIANAIKNTNGVTLLDVDSGYDTNRTVYTFVGEPENVLNAAFNAIKVGTELIDMSKHKGAHPRIGACDVCPFVPVANISMEDCIHLAKTLGKMVGELIGIPVYLYEYAATKPERKNLANIRMGEYEGLQEKLKDPEWTPDFGPAIFNEKVKRSGATVIGARDFLIAYNININSKNKNLANTIAKEIREMGKTIKDENGNKINIPGKLKECKAIGWYVEDYKRAQISINLTNYHVTNIHHAFEAAKEEAQKIGVEITGSEIVGLVPKDAIIEAGLYYLKKQGESRAVSEDEIIDIAIYSLGLSEVAKFDPDKKIIERLINKKDSLTKMTIEKFTDELGSSSPAPGGGSVSALTGSLAAALSSMVGNLTFKKKDYKDFWEEAEKLAYESFKIKDNLISLINEDTEAFNHLMNAFKLPDKTKEEITNKENAIQDAIKGAIIIPLKVMQYCNEIVPILLRMAEIGNKNAISDIAVGILNCISAIKGAYYNILINFKELKDESFKKDIVNTTKSILNNSLPYLEKKLKEIEDILLKNV
ncbi:MAG: glutamate formimidoyltransferase [Spirochaetes bacterium]|nr:glutamate formimidoyltransferase [Spirochaetota bacterium]